MYSSEKQIADGIFRLTLAPKPHFEFSQFLILDENTCLIHAGKETLFEPLKEMVQKRLGGRKLDYIVFSHVEADESGAVNKWLTLYPEAKVACNRVASFNLEDFLLRPPLVMKDREILKLGERALQLIDTPHVPHNWDAHMWFETTNKILFSSDFCCQGGNCEPVVESDISASIIEFYVKGGFIPYGKTTNDTVKRLSELPIEVIAPMHGSVVMGTSCQTILKAVASDLLQRS